MAAAALRRGYAAKLPLFSKVQRITDDQTTGWNRLYCGVMVSFTAATSWLSVKGFGRKENC
jgi:hypothetical protein